MTLREHGVRRRAHHCAIPHRCVTGRCVVSPLYPDEKGLCALAHALHLFSAEHVPRCRSAISSFFPPFVSWYDTIHGHAYDGATAGALGRGCWNDSANVRRGTFFDYCARRRCMCRVFGSWPRDADAKLPRNGAYAAGSPASNGAHAAHSGAGCGAPSAAVCG
jgi:hypothetical protein